MQVQVLSIFTEGSCKQSKNVKQRQSWKTGNGQTMCKQHEQDKDWEHSTGSKNLRDYNSKNDLVMTSKEHRVYSILHS